MLPSHPRQATTWNLHVPIRPRLDRAPLAAAWDDAAAFRAEHRPGKPKYYVLEMFPYPSGRIHIGHVRNYTMGDVVARYKRATGHAVLHPMGWDAFGLPAENAAMEKGIHPGDLDQGEHRRHEGADEAAGLLARLDARVRHLRPGVLRPAAGAVHRHARGKGLVYRKAAVVNWDPVDLTVLANEQVIDGKGWRSGAPVERKELTQWFFRISDMAEDLLEAIDGLDHWPDKVKLMQRNWIGKSRGIEIPFALVEPAGGFADIACYSTRPDTLRGASFLAISPDHPLTRALEAQRPEVAEFTAECRRSGTSEEAVESAEKKGFDTGLSVRHPVFPDRLLPVWIAQFRADGLWHRRRLRLPGA